MTEGVGRIGADAPTGLVGLRPEPLSAQGLGHSATIPLRSAVHFVWFRGDEYTRACRVWGKPDFIHMGWDRRARREIDFDRDTIVFARGEHDQPYAPRNFDDIREVAQ